MSLQDLGSVGDFLGGVGVIVSLVYLAIQIRQNTQQVAQNTRAIGREGIRSFLEDAATWRSYLIHSPEVTDLYRRGLQIPDELEHGEWLRFRMLLQGLFEHWRFGYSIRNADPLISGWESFLEGTEAYLEATLAEPGGAKYWEAEARFRAQDDELARHVDQILQRVRAKRNAAEQALAAEPRVP